MKSNYQIGSIAYVVTHCPFAPTEAERKAIEDSGDEVIEVAYRRGRDDVFPSLVKALAFAHKVVKSDFWGSVEVFEARLSNPYRDDIPDCMIKRSALRWEPVEGGYECEVER